MKNFKLLFLFLILSFLTVFFLKNSLKPTPTFAVVDPKCSPLPSPRASGGLVTANTISGNFGTTSGVCIIDPNTNFLQYKLPTYSDLVKKFYDQASFAGKATTLPGSAFTNDGLYRLSSLTRSAVPLTGTKTQVIFIDGNLDIDADLSFPTTGGDGILVFIVAGNINIYNKTSAPVKIANNIDAVLLSYGVICTAYDGTICPPSKVTTNSKLIINGSLISLKSTGGLELKRQLDDNSEPAELINYQPKVIPLLAKAGLLLEDLKIPVEQ